MKVHVHFKGHLVCAPEVISFLLDQCTTLKHKLFWAQKTTSKTIPKDHNCPRTTYKKQF